MKAAQINHYSENINLEINDISIPNITNDEVLVKTKYAAVNPLDLLIIKGSIRLIQNYDMPITLGNELVGVIEKVGKNVEQFKEGDIVYSKLPINKLGAFSEYVAIDKNDIWFAPKHLDFDKSVAIPLAGLTAYQGLKQILNAKYGQSIFIPGGSGSFGQLAVPIAKKMGLYVIVSGNGKAKERVMEAGADQFLDYKKENYWEVLDKVDFVIDTLGVEELDHELEVIKPGGVLLSLIAGPNKQFAIDQKLSWWKKNLFNLVGKKIDRKAQKQGIDYRFMFVESSGEQLKEVTKIVEEANIVPKIDNRTFDLNHVNEALTYIKNDHPTGKVVLHMD